MCRSEEEEGGRKGGRKGGREGERKGRRKGGRKGERRREKGKEGERTGRERLKVGTNQIRAVAATTAGTAMAVPVFIGTKKKKIYLACRRFRKLYM